jgi:hypothetical protein
MFQSVRPAIAALSLFAGLAPAQEAPLAGPKVTESKIPGVNEKFGQSGKDSNRAGAAAGIPPEVIRRALRALDRDDTPADARLSSDQRAQFEALVAEHKASVEAYRRKHQAEVRELQHTLGSKDKPDRANAARPPAPPRDEPMTDSAEMSPETEAARDRIERIRAGAPSGLDLQTKVWNSLTEPQRAVVKAEVDRWITEREEGKAREYVRRRMQKSGGPGQTDAFDPDKLPPRVKERLANLSPEEREKAIARLRERAKKEGPKRDKRAPDGEPRPAPPMDQVPVPAPDDSGR